MTPTARRAVGRWGTPLTGGGPTWVRVGVIVAVLVLAFVVAQTCQKSSIRLDKNQAIAKAEDQIDFTPKRTQVRLLRQGVPSQALLDRVAVPSRQDRGHLQRAGRGPHRREHRQGGDGQAAALRRTPAGRVERIR